MQCLCDAWLSVWVTNYLIMYNTLNLNLLDHACLCVTLLKSLLINACRWNHFSEEGVKQIEEAVSERNTREGVAKLELYINDQEPLS